MQRRQTQIIQGTDPNLVGQLEQEYYNVLKILIDPQLQPLKNRITMLYTNLTQQLEHEENLIKKCKMRKDQIDGIATRIASCNRMIQEQTLQADTIKKDLQKLQGETQQLKKKQSDVNHRINRQNLELKEIQNQQRKKLDQIQIQHQNQQTDLKKKLDQQNKISDQLQTKTVSLLKQQDYGMKEMSELDKKRFDINERIDQLNRKIEDIQKRDKHEKLNNEKKKQQLNLAKQQKDQLKNKKQQIQDRISKLDKLIFNTTQKLKQTKKQKDQAHREKKKQEKQKQKVQREFKRKQQEKLKAQISLAQAKQQLKKYLLDEQDVNKNRKQLERQKQMISKKLYELKAQTEKLQADKQRSLRVKQIENQKLQKLIAQRDRNKGEISSLNSKKMETDKQMKVNENKQHDIYEQNIQQTNKYKKIKNQCNSYQIEQERLAKILQQIKKEQQKYGIQASHAHSKYYQILEELRLKNTQIQNLQRQNQEVQNKCKHQQNLYEAVRSDRNLYSKDFIRSKEEISDLKKKYKRMTFQVQQLRQEIKAKDQQLVELDKEYKKVEAENVKIKADKNRAKAQIQSTEQVIKNQQNHIGHLKKIIQQAKQQKAKQQKDYDMVRNERDILGTQLIKRNQQLAVLYEKIKLSNSNLTKGEIYYKDKQKQFNGLRSDLANKRNEFMSIQEEIRSIDELRAQISFKQKDLLNQKAKVKALEDQLENPMNVHRWRKLQATDQDNYERILKIQTLQRRLIAKTQQVEAKQNLIREKQKLFLELKNILARQPGSEIHQQLIKYKEALKEKTGQMKKMKKQLEDSHQQMGRVKYDVDRIRNQMFKMKRQYFELREASEKQVMDERNFAQQMMNLNSNEAKLGGQFQGNFGGMEINSMKK